MEVCDVSDRDDRPPRFNRQLIRISDEFSSDEVRLALEVGNRAIVGARPLSHDGARAKAALSCQRVAHASTGAFSSLAMRTGSGRIARRTRVPVGCADASAVGSWARTVMSPRSIVTRLVAPRNDTAITVPISGPGTESPSAR